MKKIVAVILFLGLSSVGYGDVFDRIDDCERAGGGSCVYNLLRELARAPSGPVTLPATGAYKKTSGSSNLCEDQYIATVVENGRLSKIRLGWCGSTFNKEYSCIGNICSDQEDTIEIISRSEYRFTNENGNSGLFTYTNNLEGVANNLKTENAESSGVR